MLSRELPIDVLEIFYLTPLLGSEDHQKLYRAGTWMEPDLNKYDLCHITCNHPRMSKEEWTYAYSEAWKRYYSWEHCEQIMRRAAALRAFGNNLIAMTWFKGCIEIENVHPVEGGVLRLKSRLDRRSGLPIEPVWLFYPKFYAEVVSKMAKWFWLYGWMRKLYFKIKHDPKRFEYTDLAISPVAADETETHEMFHNDAARAYVDQERRLEKVRHAARA